MPIIQELKEQRATAIKAGREIHIKAEKEKRDLSGDELANAAKYWQEGQNLNEKINEAERIYEEAKSQRNRFDQAEQELKVSRRRTEAGQPGDGSWPASTDARRREGRGEPENDGNGPGEICWRQHISGRRRSVRISGRSANPEYSRAFALQLASGDLSSIVARGESRDLSSGIESEGGYTVAPIQMVAGILQLADDAVYIRQFATFNQVTSAQSLGIVSLDADPDDGDWTGELSAGTRDTGMKFGGRELNPQPIAKRLLISNELLRLSPDVQMLIQERLAYKFAISMEKQYMIGDGAKRPLGLFTASASGISTNRDVAGNNTTTAIKADALVTAKYTLKQQYRMSNSTAWIFHRDAMQQIALLKDGNGQYLWRQGLVTGEPDTVLGIRAVESEYAPNTFTTGKYVGILGDIRFYYIAESLGLTIRRLEELYAESNQTCFYARMQSDAAPVLEEAFVRMKLA